MVDELDESGIIGPAVEGEEEISKEMEEKRNSFWSIVLQLGMFALFVIVCIVIACLLISKD